MEHTQTTFGQLSCRIVRPTSAPRAVVLLCHGYGAPGEDLVGLAQACIDVEPKLTEATAFVFPEAPLSLAEMGMPWGRAWWHLDVARLMARQQQGPGALEELRRQTPEGLGQARRILRACIDEVLQQFRLPYAKLVMGGFSQGAMLTCDVALRLEEAPAALVQMSGTLVDEAAWTQRAGMRHGLKVLQTHGTYDPILPFENAAALRNMLQGAGLDVDFLSFPGEHTIPGEAITKLAAVCLGVSA